jgi:pimeloyl-ACP methyl ester carboxylesterase
MTELAPRTVRVSVDPLVDLFVAHSPGPEEHALLVIHGGPDWDHTYLIDPLACLAESYQLVMPDIRGCGRSTTGLPAASYTPEAAAGDLLALLDALGLDTVSMLGFSYGGLLAQRLVARAPGRVRKLIIASSALYPVPGDASDPWPERARREAPRIAAWADPRLDGPAKVRAAAVAGAQSDVWHDDRRVAYLDRLNRVHFTAEWMRPWQAGILPDANLESAEQVLAEIDLPILLLHGSHDTTVPAALAARAAARLGNAQAVIIEGAGHMTHVDQPDQWMTALEDFLNPAAWSLSGFLGSYSHLL